MKASPHQGGEDVGSAATVWFEFTERQKTLSAEPMDEWMEPLRCVGSSRLQFEAQAFRSITKAEHLHRLIFPAGSAHLGYAHSFCNCRCAAALNAIESQTCKVTEALLRFLFSFISSFDTQKHLHSGFHRHDVSAASSQSVYGSKA